MFKLLKVLLLLLIPVLFITMHAVAVANEEVEENITLCELGDDDACGYLGYVYEYGHIKEIPRDDFKAVEYYTKECELDGGVDCFNLGQMYLKLGNIYEYGKLGVIQSNARALEYYGNMVRLVMYGTNIVT